MKDQIELLIKMGFSSEHAESFVQSIAKENYQKGIDFVTGELDNHSVSIILGAEEAFEEADEFDAYELKGQAEGLNELRSRLGLEYVDYVMVF